VPKYETPPLVEVSCQFDFVPREQWDSTVPGLVYSQLREELPARKVVKRLQTQGHVDQDAVQQQFRVLTLVQLVREDGKAFAQIGPDVLSVHHLEPYPGWGEFEPFIARCFNAYGEVAPPEGLARIGLRYVNRFELPGLEFELGDYFLFRPQLPPAGLPEDHGPFAVAVHFPFEGTRDALRVSLQMTEASTPEAAAVALDLDYFLLEPRTIAVADALAWVAQAHRVIGQAFESCITDALRDRLGRGER
jgi:uncharacterized protein (TIGR04255 family)